MAISWKIQDTVHTELDSETRIATEWQPNRMIVIQERPFTAEENAIADFVAAMIVEAANKVTIEQALSDALIEVQATIDATNNQINANAATHIKVLSRAIRRIIRLLIRRFDGTA